MWCIIWLKTNLECGVQERTIEHFHAIKGGTLSNSVQLFLKSPHFILNSLSVLPCVNTVWLIAQRVHAFYEEYWSLPQLHLQLFVSVKWHPLHF